MKQLPVLFLGFSALVAFAQDPSTTATPPVEQSTRENTLTSLAGDFFNGDFVNYYAFANGLLDTSQHTLQSSNGVAGGIDVGGGVTASKHFSNSLLSLSYRGDYRNYSGGFSGSGTNQNLSLYYSRRLSNRWSLNLQEGAGILFYDNGYVNNFSGGQSAVQSNPFSPTTRFLSSGAVLSYRQSARLTYSVSGNFFLSRYSYPGAFGATGGIFSGSASYQLSSRTSIGGTYSHDNFYFQHGAGDSNIDGGFGTVDHLFGRNWSVRFSAGVTRAHTKGDARIPVVVIVGGQPVLVFVILPYDRTTSVPTIQGSLTHRVRSFSLTANVGRGVDPGNGTYLTSDHTFFNGGASRQFYNSSLGAFYSYSRLTSISNNVSHSFTQNNFTVSYSRVVFPHISVNGGFQSLRYSSLATLGGSADNRITFGVAFSSKSIPLTLF